MSAETSALLLIVAIIIGVLSLVALVLSRRPQPRAEAVSMWPPAFFHPLPSDATLLQPRTPTSHNAVTLSGGSGGLRAVREPDAMALGESDEDKYKTAEVDLMASDDRDSTNKIIHAGDADATSKNPLP